MAFNFTLTDTQDIGGGHSPNTVTNWNIASGGVLHVLDGASSTAARLPDLTAKFLDPAASSTSTPTVLVDSPSAMPPLSAAAAWSLSGSTGLIRMP